MRIPYYDSGMSTRETTRPRVGLIGILQELYIPIYPDIVERQEAYAARIIERMEKHADVVFPGAVINRATMEEAFARLEQERLDGLVIVMLTYGASFNIYNALRSWSLPIFVANVQPEASVRTEWDMADLTYNQGVHGCQDLCNALLWNGATYEVCSEDWRDEAFGRAFGDWSRAAYAAGRLRGTRIAGVGQMPGMGDIQANPASILKTLGPQVDNVGVGLIVREIPEADDPAVDRVIEENSTNFSVDPDLPEERHRYAARLQVAIERFLTANGYAGFSFYFNAPADDGRISQLPLMAASNLMAKGYGYGGEGDLLSTILVTAGHYLDRDACFTEMYAMDHDRDAFLMSHMGEGNWRIAEAGEKPRLVDRPLGIGGLDNPPTVVFRGRPGSATLCTLVSTTTGGFRLIVSVGEILPTERMPNVEMPYFFYRPDTGMKPCIDGWLGNGGSHHQCINLGDLSHRWEHLCRILGIEYARV